MGFVFQLYGWVHLQFITLDNKNMNVFILSSSYDRPYNDQLIHQINTRAKEKFTNKMGIKLKNFQELKKQLTSFKQKIFSQSKLNYLNASINKNSLSKSIQARKVQKDHLNNLKQEDEDEGMRQDDENAYERLRRRKVSLLEHKLTEQSLENVKILNHSRKKQKYREQININPMELKISRKPQGYQEHLNTLNNLTLPSKVKNYIKSRKLVKSSIKSQSRVLSQQRNEGSSDQTGIYQTKIKAEQLLNLVKQQQIKQYNKRCLDRLLNDKNKAMYNQAITKIYQLVRQKVYSNDKNDIPKELGINKIIIPKRLEKQQLTKKAKDMVPNYQNKKIQLQRQLDRKTYIQRPPKKMKKQVSRNQTECLSYRVYRQDRNNEQKINAWQIEIQNSKQFSEMCAQI